MFPKNISCLSKQEILGLSGCSMKALAPLSTVQKANSILPVLEKDEHTNRGHCCVTVSTRGSPASWLWRMALVTPTTPHHGNGIEQKQLWRRGLAGVGRTAENGES